MGCTNNCVCQKRWFIANMRRLPTGIEFCCQEISQIIDKTAPEGVGCIVGFLNVYFNPWVLQTAFYSYRQHYGENAIEGAIKE